MFVGGVRMNSSRDGASMTSLLVTVGDGLFAVDSRGLIRHAGTAICKSTGYPRDEIVGMPFTELLTNERSQPLVEALKRRAVDGQPVTLTLRTRDGHDVSLVAYLVSTFNNSGRFDGILGVLLGEQAAAPLAVVGRLRRLCEAAREGIAIHKRGEILDVNMQLTAMLGYSQGELIGMHVLEFVAPESQPLLWDRIRNVSDEPFGVVGLQRDQTQIPLEVISQIIRSDGKRVCIVCFRDVGPRGLVHQAQEEPIGKLKAKVDEEAREPGKPEPPSRRRRQDRGRSIAVTSLSARENEVLTYLASGLTNGEIATHLGVSRRTVDHHVSHILTKLNAKNRIQAIIEAERLSAAPSPGPKRTAGN